MTTTPPWKKIALTILDSLGAELVNYRDANLNGDQNDWPTTILSRLEPEKLQAGLQAFGAGMIGSRKPRNLGPEEELLHRLGQAILKQIETRKKNKALQAKQKQEIARLAAMQTRRQLNKLTPEEFEYWTGGYFERFGFKNVSVTTLSADFGVDVYMTCPNGKQAVVQCKQYKGVVGRPVVQQTYGIMKLLDAKLCYVVTTGKFTSAAVELGQRRDIVLLDGDFLVSGQRPPGSRGLGRISNQG